MRKGSLITCINRPLPSHPHVECNDNTQRACSDVAPFFIRASGEEIVTKKIENKKL